MSELKFPDSFLFGVATASFTNEGAWNEDGKGESIWDRFAHTPGKIIDGGTGDMACDHYHRYRDDISLMRELSIRAYSFSISWPRIYPNAFGKLNERGIAFYDRLIDELLAAGITPLATLYHWDLPQALEDKGGWTNPETAHHLANYASTCFRRLGDRVKLWFTVNEPGVHAVEGYSTGSHAPGRQSRSDMLLAGHTMLLAHGLAVGRFREAGIEGGQIGPIINQGPVHPASADSDADRAAADKFDAFLNRWFLDPMFLGDYPERMRKTFGPELPEITREERAILQHGMDILGINYYSRVVVANDPENVPLGIKGASPESASYTSLGWEIYPTGLHEVLTTVSTRYGNVPLYITENGASFEDEVDESGYVGDPARIAYLQDHIAQAHRAMADGVDLRGYFVYTLMDNFECALGFTPKFGIVRTDFTTQKRTAKASGKWFGEISRCRRLPAQGYSPRSVEVSP